MNPVKLGILGVSGHFLKRVVLPVQKLDTAAITAIASRSKQKAESAAVRYSIEKAYGSYDELVADKTIEAVFIPLPNHLHAEWIKKCADAGKHILCEKPLAMNAREAETAVEYAAKKNVLLLEAFMYRFHPQWIHVKELVDTGEIGEVRSVHTWFTYNNSDPKNIRNQPGTGGGALMDIGCYAISFPRFILGTEPERVFGMMTIDEQFKTDILTSGILDFGSARATFTVGTLAFPYQRCWINGTGGVIEIKIPCNVYSDVPAEVVITTGLGERVYKTSAVDQYGLQFDAFAKAVRAGAPAPVSSRDAVMNMKVIDALAASAQSDSWISL
ncbi:MAG: Gfo/Idh/MocA family oxidoreductase [Spirochaetales bacterium]|nr:Gfo/Idh/MocA family oxidoreductase [Spirochaetales bacterium]